MAYSSVFKRLRDRSGAKQLVLFDDIDLLTDENHLQGMRELLVDEQALAEWRVYFHKLLLQRMHTPHGQRDFCA